MNTWSVFSQLTKPPRSIRALSSSLEKNQNDHMNYSFICRCLCVCMHEGKPNFLPLVGGKSYKASGNTTGTAYWLGILVSHREA